MNTPSMVAASAFTSTGQWTREQSLLAFRFYCETPFGQLHAKNKNVIALAELIGRSPGALAMKCVNFASLDPEVRESGRTGLSNVSALDRAIWDEFHSNWDTLVEECESLLTTLHVGADTPTSAEFDVLRSEDWDFTGETRIAIVKQRMKQNFFRRSVLSGYEI